MNSSSSSPECLLCENPGKSVGRPINYECPRCGKYQVSHELNEDFQYKSARELLTCWVREQDLKGIQVVLTSDNIDTIVNSIPHNSALEKLDRLLDNLQMVHPHPGEWFDVFGDNDYPLAWARDTEVFYYFLDSLANQHLIEYPNAHHPVFQRFKASPNTAHKIRITTDGWKRLDELRRTPAHSTIAFVAMSFSPDLKDAWENGIRPAVKEAGYTPHRVDMEPHVENIPMKILADIKRSRFVVADLTESKHGVYLEAGYAMGLGLPVIFTVSESHKDDIHFDLKQFNQIRWKDAKDLNERLHDTISVIIGNRNRPAQ